MLARIVRLYRARCTQIRGLPERLIKSDKCHQTTGTRYQPRARCTFGYGLVQWERATWEFTCVRVNTLKRARATARLNSRRRNNSTPIRRCARHIIYKYRVYPARVSPNSLPPASPTALPPADVVHTVHKLTKVEASWANLHSNIEYICPYVKAFTGITFSSPTKKKRGQKERRGKKERWGETQHVARRRTEYPTRRMVNAYTEFLRVEQELSLYGYLRRQGGGGGRETSGREEERDRKEESGAGAGWMAGWLARLA